MACTRCGLAIGRPGNPLLTQPDGTHKCLSCLKKTS